VENSIFDVENSIFDVENSIFNVENSIYRRYKRWYKAIPFPLKYFKVFKSNL